MRRDEFKLLVIYGLYVNFKVMKHLIEHLFSGFNNIGSHNIIWNASDYPSGIYFIQIKNQSRSLSQKLMLIK